MSPKQFQRNSVPARVPARLRGRHRHDRPWPTCWQRRRPRAGDDPLAPQEAALPGEGEERHLPVHGRRAQPDGSVRSQAGAAQVEWQASAAVDDQGLEAGVHQADRRGAGQSVRISRSTAQCGMELSELIPHTATCADDICLVRSMYSEAFNHHPGQLLLFSGTHDRRASVHGRVGHLRAGQRVAESARLRRAELRRGHQRRLGQLLQWLYAVDLCRARCSATRAIRSCTCRIRRASPRRRSARGWTLLQRSERGALCATRAMWRSPRACTLTNWRIRMQIVGAGVARLLERVRRRRWRCTASTKSRRKPFGTNCLLARRLVERGVRFVMLMHASWDHHSEICKGLKQNCGITDQPAAALIRI